MLRSGKIDRSGATLRIENARDADWLINPEQARLIEGSAQSCAYQKVEALTTKLSRLKTASSAVLNSSGRKQIEEKIYSARIDARGLGTTEIER